MPRPFWFLFAGMFVNRIGSFVLPFLTLYLTQVRHISIAQAGLVVAGYGAGGAVAGPVGGFLADRIGRRATMLIALGFGGSLMIALGFVTRLEVLAPLIFCYAAVGEMYRSGMQAAIGDLVPHSERTRAFGLVYWVINLGWSFGLVIGGLLAGVSYRWLFVGDGLTTLLFAAIVAAGVPETRPAAAAAASAAAGASPAAFWREFTAPYRDGPFVAFLFLSFLIAGVFMQNASTFPLDLAARGISKPMTGLLLALNGIVIVFVQPALSAALARRNRSKVIAAGAAVLGLGFGLHAPVTTALGFAGAVLVWTMGEMAVLPVANAIVADLAPVELRGRYQGAYSLSFGLAVSAAPAGGAYVLEHFGRVALWGGCAVVGLLVAAGPRALARRLTRLREARIAARG
ncbi:MAG: MFS transporter [Candidatus Eisenbacteria bacterium]